jgi:N-glycosylase/DNA lyase
MQKLVDLIQELSKDKKLVTIIHKKISSFKAMQKKSSLVLFQELCFCILTANFNAKRAIEIQENINDGFNTFSKNKLSTYLKKYGHRFPNARTKYICCSRAYQKDLKNILFSFENTDQRRDWLVKNIKGLGYKEASHFLRNIGFLDVAIIDFHIVDILVDNKIIEKPKTLSKKEYVMIENKLKILSKKVNLSLGELDLYLWFSETGSVLK